MDPNVSAWLELVLRWAHVIAGVVWIGHLYFFNFVNAQLVKTYDADSKKKVVPELMPRALYWFRWGAMYTWVTGLLLATLVYYHVNNVVPQDGSLGAGAGAGVGLAVSILAFFVYDPLWKSPLAKNETAGAVVSFLLVAAVTVGLSRVFIGRALYIHIGMMFGTIMFLNVWMRIWPAQRKIIAGIKGTGPAPDASVAALAGLRSKHNTYMSVPLLFTMVSNHFPTVYGNSSIGWIVLLVIIAAGWGLTKFFYTKSASAAPTEF